MRWYKLALILTAGWVALSLVLGVVGYIMITSHDRSTARPGNPSVGETASKVVVPRAMVPAVAPGGGAFDAMAGGEMPGPGKSIAEEHADRFAYHLGQFAGFGIAMTWVLCWWMGPGPGRHVLAWMRGSR